MRLTVPLVIALLVSAWGAFAHEGNWVGPALTAAPAATDNGGGVDGAAKPGRFYLVGMGTYPDLVTLRGLRVIEDTDLFVLEERTDLDAWGDLIGQRPVIFCPHESRVLYGLDPETIEDPLARAVARRNDKFRKDTVKQIADAVMEGKVVSSLQWGDCMVYGTTFYLEMLPEEVPTEIVPSLGAFEAGSAAIKWSPTFGGSNNAVILTMGDFEGRADSNDKLAKLQTAMVAYTCGLSFPLFFKQLNENYDPDTPVAVVCYAGVPGREQVVRSTVGRFMDEVDYKALPYLNIIFVGNFIGHGQARCDYLLTGKDLEKLLKNANEADREAARLDPDGLRTDCASPRKED